MGELEELAAVKGESAQVRTVPLRSCDAQSCIVNFNSDGVTVTGGSVGEELDGRLWQASARR